MIRGKLVIVGEINLDGVHRVGAFIECSKEELKRGRDLFFEEVAIVEPPTTTVNADEFQQQ